MSADIVRRLNQEVNEGLKSAELKATSLLDHGQYRQPGAVWRVLKEEAVRWGASQGLEAAKGPVKPAPSRNDAATPLRTQIPACQVLLDSHGHGSKGGPSPTDQHRIRERLVIGAACDGRTE
jgi:hypothetical protein